MYCVTFFVTHPLNACRVQFSTIGSLRSFVSSFPVADAHSSESEGRCRSVMCVFHKTDSRVELQQKSQPSGYFQGNPGTPESERDVVRVACAV
jgi:hypothetical protein